MFLVLHDPWICFPVIIVGLIVVVVCARMYVQEALGEHTTEHVEPSDTQNTGFPTEAKPSQKHEGQ